MPSLEITVAAPSFPSPASFLQTYTLRRFQTLSALRNSYEKVFKQKQDLMDRVIESTLRQLGFSAKNSEQITAVLDSTIVSLRAILRSSTLETIGEELITQLNDLIQEIKEISVIQKKQFSPSRNLDAAFSLKLDELRIAIDSENEIDNVCARKFSINGKFWNGSPSFPYHAFERARLREFFTNNSLSPNRHGYIITMLSSRGLLAIIDFIVSLCAKKLAITEHLITEDFSARTVNVNGNDQEVTLSIIFKCKVTSPLLSKRPGFEREVNFKIDIDLEWCRPSDRTPFFKAITIDTVEDVINQCAPSAIKPHAYLLLFIRGLLPSKSAFQSFASRTVVSEEDYYITYHECLMLEDVDVKWDDVVIADWNRKGNYIFNQRSWNEQRDITSDFNRVSADSKKVIITKFIEDAGFSVGKSIYIARMLTQAGFLKLFDKYLKFALFEALQLIGYLLNASIPHKVEAKGNGNQLSVDIDMHFPIVNKNSMGLYATILLYAKIELVWPHPHLKLPVFKSIAVTVDTEELSKKDFSLERFIRNQLPASDHFTRFVALHQARMAN